MTKKVRNADLIMNHTLEHMVEYFMRVRDWFDVNGTDRIVEMRVIGDFAVYTNVFVLSKERGDCPQRDVFGRGVLTIAHSIISSSIELCMMLLLSSLLPTHTESFPRLVSTISIR